MPDDPCPEHAPAAVSGATVLVVEDDATIRGLLTDLLGSAGLAVETVVGGEDAVRLLETKPYACIIVDYTLAGWLNGLDLLRELRAVRADTPIVMLTSNADAALKRDALGAGAFAFETKPIESIDRFAAVIARAIASRRRAGAPPPVAPARRPPPRAPAAAGRDPAELEALFQQARDEREVFALLLAESMRAIGAACGFVARWHAAKRLLEIVAERGLPSGTPMYIPVTVLTGPLTWVVRHRVALIEDDLTEERLRGLETWLEPPLVVVTPIIVVDDLRGVCVLNNSDNNGAPRRPTFDLLCALAQRAGETLARHEPG
jgi:DNA-binding response OmpR family regulator